jgi:Zn-dependent protease with chaperone function
MIYIALNVIFNAFILAIILFIGSDFMHIKPHIAWCLGYVIAALLAIIGYTKFATSIMGLFTPGRKMVVREITKLESLFQGVINKTNNEYNTNYKLADFNIKVSDNKIVNTFAIGYDTIIINRGAFEKLTNEQLQAVLAHNMGCLYYRDSVRSTALLFSSLGSRVIMGIYGIYLAFATIVSNSFKGKNSKILALISWLPLLVFLPVIILNFIGAKLFNILNLKASRDAEYRADAFAINLGYKADLISALEVLDAITIHDNSFVAKLMSSHLPTMSRIGAIEDEKIATPNLVTPFVATNSSDIGGNSEALRLGAILCLGAVIWCYFGMVCVG